MIAISISFEYVIEAGASTTKITKQYNFLKQIT